jgi:hypothetical protein
MSDTQVTPAELQQIKDFKLKFNNLIFALGENRIRKEQLLDSYKSLTIQEQEFISRLSIKYGDGVIDAITGKINYKTDAKDSGNSEGMDSSS